MLNHRGAAEQVANSRVLKRKIPVVHDHRFADEDAANKLDVNREDVGIVDTKSITSTRSDAVVFAAAI